MPTHLDLPLDPDLNADAYLQWATLTEFKYFNLKPSDTYVVLAEFSEPLNRTAIERMRGSKRISISSWYEGQPYAAIMLSKEDFKERFVAQLRLLQEFGAICIELASPTGMVMPEFPTGVAPGSDTVIGVIDDGCPFAHVHLRGAAPNEPTVRFIWDQGSGAFYTQAALKALIAGAKTTIGSIDEDSAYLTSGLPSLRFATSHGAQVLSHASGHARDTKPLPPHTLKPIDIAFVQLPGYALDQPAGEWLHHLAVEGIYAIRTYARSMCTTKASRILINLSYGPRTGPHDGTSVLEKVIDFLTAEAASDHYDLRVVVPSGNSHLDRAHAQFDLAQGGGTIDWHVAPDTQTPCFVEIWLPTTTLIGDILAYLVAPNGEVIPAEYLHPHPNANNTAWTVTVHVCGDVTKKMILMVIAPTARTTATDTDKLPLATPGRWKIGVKMRPGHAGNGIAHAYLSRNEPNLGRIRRGYDGYFDTPTYDPNRYLQASTKLDVNPATLGPAEVVAAGSINGIATGAKSEVIAAYYASGPGMPSSYSSGSPTRGLRVQPDWAYPGDDSKVLSGRLAGGNRSATVMRLIGTSFTAPQFVYESIVLPLPPVSASVPPRTERLGDGCR
ncbi:MAG: hypothetical protein J7605_20865 [Variovorax sp.]|nr:hypothetical protein [Variovorax sp.]